MHFSLSRFSTCPAFQTISQLIIAMTEQYSLSTISSMLNNNAPPFDVTDFKLKTFQDPSSVTAANDVPTNIDPDDKKLLRKLDFYLIPTMTVLYLLSFLDRVNIGQAKLNGLTETLSLSSIQYNTCLSVFFITYILFEIPSNLALKVFRPSRWIPIIMIFWGLVTTFIGYVNSYSVLLVCRLLLGAAESGLFPG